MERVPYSNAVRSIMYTMVCTRPDLAFVISTLGRFMANPGLVYKSHGNNIEVEGFSDSDYAGVKDIRRSTSTYFFLVNGNCISWKSQLQPVVALSTTEDYTLLQLKL
ncbi:secreted RxLR effector protein 161-like [Humulus lupulus]|uniref:secreted RxLR effector protein 161-like n=1 Tax=Humulus lupulus TaxID=3486 RepID=UPI002B402E35|nr:secreted RxLR effector protein 161-like [Humulus lupulus]